MVENDLSTQVKQGSKTLEDAKKEIGKGWTQYLAAIT